MGVFIAQLVATGMTIGGIYALIAVGLHLIYNATGIFNMAQGGFVAWGGLLLYLMYLVLGLPLWVSLLLSVVGVAIIGAVTQRVAVETVRDRPHLVPILTCLFAGVVLDSISSISLKGNIMVVPAFSGGSTIKVLGAGLAPQSLWILGSTVLVLLSLFLFFKKTTWGRVMVANADNPEGTAFIGANPSGISLLAFALGGALGGISGVLIAPLTGVRGEAGLAFVLKGLAAAMLGGVSSTAGVIIGGFLLGLFEAFVGGLISSGLRNAFVFSLVIVVLVVRPTGIMGKPEIEKV